MRESACCRLPKCRWWYLNQIWNIGIVTKKFKTKITKTASPFCRTVWNICDEAVSIKYVGLSKPTGFIDTQDSQQNLWARITCLHSLQRKIIEIHERCKTEKDAYRSIKTTPGIFMPLNFRNLTKVSTMRGQPCWAAGLLVWRRRRHLQKEFQSLWARCQFIHFIQFSF